MEVAKQGGEIVRNARRELEIKTGKPAISVRNAKSGIMLGKKSIHELEK